MSGPLARPSNLQVSYDDKPGAIEGDYVLHAYFDKDGKLIDTEIQEYWK